MNARSSTFRSSSQRRSTINIIGVTVLVLGLSVASVVLVMGVRRSNGTGAAGAPGDWQDNSLSVEDSKASSHDLEMYNGKMGMLALKLTEAFQQPESLAMIIAVTSSLIAVGCFYVSRQLYSDHSTEDEDPLP